MYVHKIAIVAIVYMCVLKYIDIFVIIKKTSTVMSNGSDKLRYWVPNISLIFIIWVALSDDKHN